MKNALVYLSGPISAAPSHDEQANIQAGIRAFHACIRADIPAFLPHFCATVPSDIDYEQWTAYDFAIIDRCTHMLMLDRWELSSGALREKAYAEARGLPIYFSLEALCCSF